MKSFLFAAKINCGMRLANVSGWNKKNKKKTSNLNYLTSLINVEHTEDEI